MSPFRTVVPFASVLIASSLAAQQERAAETKPWFEPPFRVEAEGGPIAVATGHAAPWVVDFDGDGVRDLAVGQFGDDGTCRLYRNLGTDREPRFGSFTLLQSEGKPASMESS